MKIAFHWALLAVALSTVPASAGPSGPSAKTAARLKKYPTSRWLAHYLPDDRYKIAGGVWRFVSTDLDTYYHRPDSPNMLRQPAGRVIGFASAQEAEEAGYRPDPNLDSFGFGGGGGASMRGVSGRRVMLSDGVSSLILPVGWSRSPGTSTRSAQAVVSVDQLNGPRGQRLVISTVTVAGQPNAQIDMGRIASVEFFNSLQGGLRQFSSRFNTMSQASGSINSQFSGERLQGQINQLQNSTKISRMTLGGITGISVLSTVRRVGQPVRSYLVGRGPKLWSVADFSPNRQSAIPILRSMQLR
ncbi:MAG TPA: hypothetical protein VF627_09455 [Abditibacterium sp.]|jgi:hypothetical protein